MANDTSPAAGSAARFEELGFRTLVAHAPFGVVLGDMQRRPVAHNPALERMLGYTTDELRHLFFPDYTHPDDIQRDLALYEETLAGGRDSYQLDKRYLRKDGSTLWVHLTVILLRDREERAQGTLALIEDISERRRAEQRLAAEHAVTRVLAQAASAGEALPQLLQAVCSALGWDVGLLWEHDAPAGRLRCAAAWYDPARPLADFEATCRRMAFRPGEGMPGGVWQSGAPLWASGVGQDLSFLRAEAAARHGLRSVFGFPVQMGGDFFGVMEFFTRDTVVHDEALLRTAQSLGSEIGQFLARARAETALHETHSMLQALIQASPVAILGLDPAQRVTLWNAAAERILGWPAAAVLGRTLPTADSDARELSTLVHEITGGEVLEGIELRHRRPDGTPADLRFWSAPVRDARGEVRSAVVAALDVTEARRAERALAERERLFRSLIENVSDVIFVLEGDGEVRFVSSAAESWLGYSPAALHGRSLFDLVHPEDVPALLRHFDRMILNPGTAERAELRLRRREGGWRIHEAVGTSLLHDPAVFGIILNSRDITERRATQEALHESQQRLLHSQKLEAVGRLAGGVAHDFNNLLTAIKGNVQLMLMDLPDSSPLRPELDEVHRAADRAAALTRQLLAFSRRQVLQPEVVDLNAVVRDTEKLLRRLIGEDVELVLHTDPVLGRVLADRGQMEQVIMNLAVNARDAMPAGGRLVLGTANQVIGGEGATAHAELPPGPYVCLEVRDTGSGMEPELLPAIFEPFFTTKEPGKGTGLGLSTVYGIVQQSGGTIEVESTVGQGTAFYVYLPRIHDDAPVAAAAPAPLTFTVGSETVLLVEDEPGVRRLTRRVLERAGYQVLEAASGEEALQRCDEHPGPIHLLLSDVVMPRMSGATLAARIAQHRPEVRVLYMSGYADEAILHHGVAGRGIAFVQKPFIPEELLRRVQEVLQGGAGGEG